MLLFESIGAVFVPSSASQRAPCPRNPLHNVGSVAAECFVSAPSILLDMYLSPLDQGLPQRTSRHS